jgi:type IV fimbrial biogenesis protein FimT
MKRGLSISTKTIARRGGFTLVELLAAICVVAITTVMAIPMYTHFMANQRVKATASDLYLFLIKARSEALRRNANVTIKRTGSSWESGWDLEDSSNTVIETHAAVTGISIADAPSTITYLVSGRIQGNTAPNFLVSSTVVSSVQQCVTADPSGRPYAKASAC